MNALQKQPLTAASLLAVIFASSACEEAPPQTRAGVWKATTDCGDFTLFVSDDGNAVTNANWEIRKPDLGNDPLRLKKETSSTPWDRPFAFQGRELSMHFNKGHRYRAGCHLQPQR